MEELLWQKGAHDRCQWYWLSQIWTFPKKFENVSLENHISLLKMILQILTNHQNYTFCSENWEILLHQEGLDLLQRGIIAYILLKEFGPPRGWYQTIKISRKCKQHVIMMKLPVNLNKATTAYKLGGVIEKNLIIHNWTYTHGWVYTVLTYVRTLDGLFLNKSLLFKADAFKVTSALLAFQWRMSKKFLTRLTVNLFLTIYFIL